MLVSTERSSSTVGRRDGGAAAENTETPVVECGIKNSGCPSVVVVDHEEEEEEESNDGTRRFVFVDLVDGLWSTSRSGRYEVHRTIVCPAGGSVVFRWPNGRHDVVAVPDEDRFDRCDCSTTETLAPAFQNASFEFAAYYHDCATTPGATEYLTCSLPGHCERGQKIKVRTSDTARVWNDDDDDEDGGALLHATSLRRVLRLMAHRVDPATGFVVMDSGYQTEELADRTLEWIWCGMEHCPDFDDVTTYDDETTTTVAREADCNATALTLAALVSRGRPVPNWDDAERYYRRAIALPGRDDRVTECVARSYLIKMFLDRGNRDAAREEARSLCDACRGPAHEEAVSRTRYEFGARSDVAWPCSATTTTFDVVVSSAVPSVLPTSEILFPSAPPSESLSSSSGHHRAYQTSSSSSTYLVVHLFLVVVAAAKWWV